MREFAQFIKGCDLLIHDAQYLPEELKDHRGWGHSTYEEAVTLALQAGVRSLLLTHHDPGRSDDQVRQIVERARKMAAAEGGGSLQIDAAQEGSSLHLS